MNPEEARMNRALLCEARRHYSECWARQQLAITCSTRLARRGPKREIANRAAIHRYYQGLGVAPGVAGRLPSHSTKVSPANQALGNVSLTVQRPPSIEGLYALDRYPEPGGWTSKL